MGGTHLQDLPEVIQMNIVGLSNDTRSRNAMALVCRKWYFMERVTRTSITLRGNVRHLYQLPTCFQSVIHLDLSLLSPWGYSFFHFNPNSADADADAEANFHAVAVCLQRAFPLVTSLTVYARNSSVLHPLILQWPHLRRVKLVRWHQRPSSAPGSDFVSLFNHCTSLTDLDLSCFYCWTEDFPAALQASSPVATKYLTGLDLLSLSSVEGFRSHEILTISSACPSLHRFLAPCVFDQRYHGFVGDETLLILASNCKYLSKLHLVDHSALSAPRADPVDDANHTGFSSISPLGLQNAFAGLSMLEDLVLDVCHNVSDAGPALEGLNQLCPRLRSLKLGQFLGVCTAAALHLDGVAVCGGLTSLSIKNSADLTDAGLVTIARGCSRLSKFEIQGCRMVTVPGFRKLASMLRSTLVEVGISCCKYLDAPRSLSAIEPIRDRIKRLNIDWIGTLDDDVYDDDYVVVDDDDDDNDDVVGDGYDDDDGDLRKKKHRRQSEIVQKFPDCSFWCKAWKKLQHLSLWIPVAKVLSPLADIGFESCPELEEVCMKVEGDCRTCDVPSTETFGLISLMQYPKLSKMKLDCGDAIGYALTAPKGQLDLSLWERFYLSGIRELNLSELDYWPPQDKDMNQRSISLPAVGLLAECTSLRKLFIHGTAHEHFLRFLLNIPNLRDVQLREDYYPAPENDTSTEMRIDSCRRFDEALNRRFIPD
ncbi:More axillary branches 2 [Zostera marina]|uniref:More axillary branches 2 n=1 Tax=Zostera marina TaxID=29655 RepID=A0A0K9Q1R8_ZOSMR|nr:More axillary branches 2 [Zostera marina]